MRVKRGIHRHRRTKKLKALVKGYRGMKRTTVKKAKEAVIKAGQNAYRDRKLKKRTFRSLWIVRLNNALRNHGITYRAFIALEKEKNIELDRKVLSQMAMEQPAAFEKFIESVK